MFADGARTADQHQDQAIAIMAKLDGADGKPAATAPERRNDRREEREERREQRQENKQMWTLPVAFPLATVK